MNLAAHSAPSKRLELGPHGYAEHIRETLCHGLAIANDMLSYCSLDEVTRSSLLQTIEAAIMLHDIGKLDDANQKVLSGQDLSRGLPRDHIDAGTAIAQKLNNELLGWLIRGHHAPGLPSKREEKRFKRYFESVTNTTLASKFPLRGRRYNRKSDCRSDYEEHARLIKHTDAQLEIYKDRQVRSCGDYPEISFPLPKSSLITRLMLSCLVDADHESAACFSNDIPMSVYSKFDNRWDERLSALNKYIEELQGNSPTSDRNRLRAEFYKECQNTTLFDAPIATCSMPVGLGKTTSVTAYLLKQAIKYRLRRIFVIAPFTNIIHQTVETLRKSLVLEGEVPEEIVVEHHHKTDFSSVEMRKYTALWKAPIVVTTAVQFFETLANAKPTPLRKLNSVPGSAIFIDESHACLPPHLLSIAWLWMNQLANDFSCRLVLSSGSLAKFWEDKEIIGCNDTQRIPDIVSDDLLARAKSLEPERVKYISLGDAISLCELLEKLRENNGNQHGKNVVRPCTLIILNTVQNAANIAKKLAYAVGQTTEHSITCKRVLHLSTALAPIDRQNILKEVERRQKSVEWGNEHWYLVATSCVEAGVDLDFSVGYRERCSGTSFLQVSGRINRNTIRGDGVLYDFSLLIEKNDNLNRHLGFKESIAVFSDLSSELFSNSNNFDPTVFSTKTLMREFRRKNSKGDATKVLESEKNNNFQDVMVRFKIIDADTRTVIVDKGLVEKLETGMFVNWQDIQNKSVQLWVTKIEKLKLKPIGGENDCNVYSWVDTYEYDPDFLGIMAGLLDVDDLFRDHGGVI